MLCVPCSQLIAISIESNADNKVLTSTGRKVKNGTRESSYETSAETEA